MPVCPASWRILADRRQAGRFTKTCGLLPAKPAAKLEKRQAVMAECHDCGMLSAVACHGAKVHWPPQDGQPQGDGVWHFGAELR